ncbi:hypothetical protein BCV69DRAFT_284303 [Microstroma glucosiphilum]|uniref:Uncharacterized protein n=1 Tax=Pseudomicrostroma glucosiphilum TaxID=1684307 RepID=A0A316U178_9BASI|nr:hypothetical protein BCV69DRAFT_284303 [Pseudomicrostroma glucosiphilum]PWN19146.1 hypothetical protein BCV69DRAFT_284303 [Pseudomicrostroma glucosiphilum]
MSTSALLAVSLFQGNQLLPGISLKEFSAEGPSSLHFFADLPRSILEAMGTVTRAVSAAMKQAAAAIMTHLVAALSGGTCAWQADAEGNESPGGRKPGPEETKCLPMAIKPLGYLAH